MSSSPLAYWEAEVKIQVEQPTNEARRAPDLLARVISILALSLAGFTLWYQSCRPADIAAYPGQKVYVRGGANRLGVPVIFVNRGARIGEIEAADLTLQMSGKGPRVPFKLGWYSPATEGERETSRQARPETLPLDIYDYSPLAVLPSQPAFRVFWFDAAEPGFRFEAGSYTATIAFYKWRGNKRTDRGVVQEPVSSTSLSFNLAGAASDAVKSDPNASVPVEIQRLP